MDARWNMRTFALGALVAAATTWASAEDNGAGEVADANQAGDVAPITVAEDSVYQEAGYTTHADAASGACACQPACGCGGGAACTCEKMKALKKAVATSHKGVFYDNKFDYLCDPCYDDWVLGDNLKRIGLGNCLITDFGGQYRLRGQSERNIRFAPPGTVTNRMGLTGFNDDFLLQRVRLYSNTEIGERVRVYAEMLDAQSGHERYAPRAIEENRFELQNLFADVVMLDDCRGKLTSRVGRQELLYGSQRLVSPLDWANTRRTFEGGKLMWKGDKWDIDAFWVRPLRRNVDQLDPPNLDRQFYGIYSTYKGLGKNTLDLYWLALDYDDTPTAGALDTLGGRYVGSRDAWLYEAEGGVQFGRNFAKTDHAAGFYTLGLGRKFEGLEWKPVLWSYYDWASGDRTVNQGFHHYEPLAHKYLGFMDLYGRRNIEDVNFQLILQPQEKLTLMAWHHLFWLQNKHDVPYNVDETPFAGLPANSAASRYLGQELDLTATYAVTPRAAVLLGYSHFFRGDFYRLTPGVPYRGDADFFYTEFTLNF